ncbi:hypothetical protein Bpfe_003290, partial [Biomphalaria pfeifferi]
MFSLRLARGTRPCHEPDVAHDVIRYELKEDKKKFKKARLGCNRSCLLTFRLIPELKSL